MSRLKRTLKSFGIAAAVLIALALIFNAFFVLTLGTQLERRLDALRQAGDPIALADLAHPLIPPENNADAFLRRAADDLDAIQKALLEIYPKNGYPVGAVSPSDNEKMDALFAAHPDLMGLLENAARCSDSDPGLEVFVPTTGFLGPYMQMMGKRRVLIRVLRARCAWLLAKGRVDDALGTQLLSLRLTRQWRHDPLIIGYLVTASCEAGAMESINQVLQTGAVSPGARRALDTELALHDTLEGYVWALKSERAYTLSSVRELPVYRFFLTRGLGNDLMLRLLDLYDRYLAAAGRPYGDAASGTGHGSSSSAGGGLNPFVALVTLLEPALEQCREPAERTRALARSLRVLNAAQSCATTGAGRLPELAELGLPVETTTDPYNGRPLHLKKLPEGWMVYSVGRNRADDGGILDSQHDVGAGPITPTEPNLKR